MLEGLQRHKGLILLGLLVAVALVYGAWPRALVVDGVKVWRGPMSVTINEQGKTRVIDRFVISAPVSGFMRRSSFRVGDQVKKGQVIVELEPLRSTVLDPRARAEAQARVAAANAVLDSAHAKSKVAAADANLAHKTFKRKQKLYSSKLISVGELDTARAQLRKTAATQRSAEFAVKVARFELQAAQTTLKYSATGNVENTNQNVRIRAPVSGQILKIRSKSEGVVKSGQSLIEMGDPSALEVVVDVLSIDAVRLKPGTRIHFKRWGGPGILDGIVRRIEPVGFTKVSVLGVEEQRVLIVADIVSPRKKWDRLGDGYTVDASFIVWHGNEVLQIPASAVFRRAGKWAVFTIVDQRARLRLVEVGRRSGLTIELKSPLNAGTWVVKHPGDEIENGDRIKLRTSR